MSTARTPSDLKPDDADDAVDLVARVGLVAYGVVHLLVAVLALRLAFGGGSGSASQQGALAEIARQPFGKVLVWAVAIGLFCLVAWRVQEAVAGFRDEPDDSKRVRKRIASGIKAAVYLALGISGVRIAIGSKSGDSSDKSSDTWTARIMDLPAGQVLVALVGLAIIAAGCYLGYVGLSGEAKDKLDGEGKSGDTGRALVVLGNAGYLAKGLSIALVGGLFCYAGITHDPDKSGGLDEALHTLLGQPFGVVLLVVVALGLGAYGVFSLARARHLDR